MWRWFSTAVLAVTACSNDVRPDPDVPSTVPARVRLLTDSQYANAVTDLLGPVTLPELHTPGTDPHQFVYESVIGVDATQLVQYRIAAQMIGREVGGRDLFGCAGDRTCVHIHLATFASRAFRRPLEGNEAQQLADMYDDGGLGLAIEAILQAPSFIYRAELGTATAGRLVLDSYELASAVSFLLLDSIPDDELWRHATDGTLLETDVLAAQVDRLIATPRVQANLDQIVLDWLQIPRVLGAAKDPALFPGLDPWLQTSMFEETATFVHDVLWRRHGSLRELLTSRATFADERLAAHYGIAGVVGDDPVRITAPPYRAGILTQASVLTMLATPRSESIIQRGVYVNRLFLCTPDPGRPPFGAITAVQNLTSKLSESQFGYYRAQNAYCASCHATVDPPGWALNHFDGIGHYRAVDANAIPVESDTTLVIDRQPHAVGDAVALATTLAASPQVAACVVDQFARHALGRAASAGDILVLDHAFVASDLDLTELIRAITLTRSFRERAP